LTVAALLVLALAAPAAALGQTAPRPPSQPATGPGGAETVFERVEARRVGSPPTGAWLFVPEGKRPSRSGDGPRVLPVVLFLHGFTALDPGRYRSWIDHIARRGAVVVYPDYQATNPFGEDWRSYLPNTLDGVRAALAVLASDPERQVDAGRVAVVGHSLGGVLAAGYTAAAAAAGLPEAVALMVAMPGGCRGCEPLLGDRGAPLPDLSRVSAEIRVLVVEADDDEVVAETAARQIWTGLSGVPLDRRDHVTLLSDSHGEPALRADHLLPQTAGRGGTLDALDWYGVWKLFDLLADCALFAQGCGQAQGGTAEQRFMGLWSDGVPLREAVVTDAPSWEVD
jgi:acetyl esterase/lipase